MRWLNVQEIYADGRHNAWPDICRWRGRYYVAFNCGGGGHGGGHGLCFLSSADGVEWVREHATGPDEWAPSDDATRGGTCPKLLPTEERLYVVFNYYREGVGDVDAGRREALARRWRELGGSPESFERWARHHEALHQSGIAWSEDGRTFSEPRPLLGPGWRVWRPHGFGGKHYLAGYCCHGQSWSLTPELERMIPEAETSEMFESASLFVSEDGEHWEKAADIATDDNDEPDFDFTEDGRILLVSRTGASLKRPAMAYSSEPPYHRWRRFPLSEPLNAPAVRRVSGRWVVAGRGLVEGTSVPSRFAPGIESDAWCATRIWLLDEKTGELTAQTTLPSWGDGSYPGIEVTEEGELLVVYYSCSQSTDDKLRMGPGPLPGKMAPCSIYLARVSME